ncbi:hypothetical protein [Deinococcus sp. QL22]|uniref:hypothetical protein n=1 Tax=Deinococcus sp. QL22 TaxID=2939437 RepID=UPI002016AABF|nr:hypothetical protein [Deinococcus sp. QL22]UQN05480.1 hypothetical protein M1R55_11400 [Deinococcus sp. QL22]
MILSSEAALQQYHQLREQMGAGNSTKERQGRMQDLLLFFSQSLLAPFRIALELKEPKPTFHLLVNQGAQGMDEHLWEMHGYYREMDMIRLAVTFRNIYYSGHVMQRETQKLEGSLIQAMPNVENVMLRFLNSDE